MGLRFWENLEGGSILKILGETVKRDLSGLVYWMGATDKGQGFASVQKLAYSPTCSHATSTHIFVANC